MPLKISEKFKKCYQQIWSHKGSPCNDCLIRVTCDKMFSNNSACEKLKVYLIELIIKEGLRNEEDTKE
jgi:hypothetical protein